MANAVFFITLGTSTEVEAGISDMPKKYDKAHANQYATGARSISTLNKDQYTSVTNKTQLMDMFNNQPTPVFVTDYSIVIDKSVSHEMGWDELMRWIERVGAARAAGVEIGNWFDMNEEPTSQNQPKNIKIRLPTKEMLIEGDTNGYLVLISEDKKKVIMPKYGQFLNDKIPEIEGTGMFTKSRNNIISR